MTDSMQDKKESIIKAAVKLFTERGFHGTPTAMISQEAGVSTGTLFRYFPTKEDLINSTYAIAKEHLATAMAVGLGEETTIRGKTRRIWANMIYWGLKNPEEALFIDQFNHSPYITWFTEEEAMKSYGFINEMLDEGIRCGALKDMHRGLMMEMMYHANTAVVKKILLYGLQSDAERLIDQSYDLVWSGFSKQ